jgi:outer membrane protein TolC
MEIFSAYLDIQQGRSELLRVEQSKEETTEIYRLANERQNFGTGLKADTLTAKVQLADSERQLVSAQNQLLLAQYRLAFLVGSDTATVDIAEPLNVNFIAAVEASNSLSRPDLEALKWQEQAAELTRLQARAEWLPRLQAGASWSHHAEDYPLAGDADSWTLQASLSWTLFDGMARSHRSAKALAQEKAAAATYRQSERQARLQVVQARLNADTAASQLETGKLAVAAAEEGYQLMLSRYRNGLATMAELLRVQSQLEKSRAELSSAENYLIRVRAQQLYVAGNFLEALLGEKGI